MLKLKSFSTGASLVLLLTVALGLLLLSCARKQKPTHLSPIAWSEEQWIEASKGIRTSYNPDHDLNTEELTLVPGDERWLDFVYWCLNNKIAEHQVEAYGGTEWQGPTGGVIFHWAPGSRWETHTLASFGFTIGHVIGEHRWQDTQFPEFFEKYGGVYGVNVKDRLTEIDPNSPTPWVEFLEYTGGANSPYYRYLFHQEAVIDPVNEAIYLIGGQGAGFAYSFNRYYHEVREVLTDAKAFQFFQAYDLYGPGFASKGAWARQKLPAQLQRLYRMDEFERWTSKPGVARAEKYEPNPPSPPIPEDIPELESVKRGQEVYKAQCTPCHGIKGDGNGFLAKGFDVKPRDFTQGLYKFRSTKTGAFPTLADIERSVREGVPNTTMPAWGQFLTPEQVTDVSRYIITFSPKFTEAWKAGQEPAALAMSAVPGDLMADAMIDLGRETYEKAECAKCHGALGKGDGPSANTLQDSWGYPIEATDLTYKWVFKNGHQPEDVYRTMFGGLNGTPMPAYEEAFPDEKDRWAMVAYILSLSPKERPVITLAEYKSRIRTDLDDKGRVMAGAVQISTK